MRRKVERPNFHEILNENEAVTPGSERSFGVVMAAVLALLSLLNWFHEGHGWLWLGGGALLLFGAALLWPAALKPLNWVWFKLGLLMHAVVTPVIMGLLFYLAIWPTGVVMRMLGKDLLRLRREPSQESYWIIRSPPGPSGESMKDQF